MEVVICNCVLGKLRNGFFVQVVISLILCYIQLKVLLNDIKFYKGENLKFLFCYILNELFFIEKLYDIKILINCVCK